MAGDVTKTPVSGKVKVKDLKKGDKYLKEFTIETDVDDDGNNGREIYVVFGANDNCTVEKLKIKGANLDETNYTWYSFFNVKKGGKILKSSDNITYSIYINTDATIIAYYDGTNYGTMNSDAEEWNGVTMRKITFTTGDPGIGVTT